MLIQAGIWKQQQQQHSEAAETADPWEAGWSSEEWSGSQVESPGWAALGPFPFPSHLTSSGPDLTLQQGMGKPGRVDTGAKEGSLPRSLCLGC